MLFLSLGNILHPTYAKTKTLMDYYKRYVHIHLKNLILQGQDTSCFHSLNGLVEEVDQYLFLCKTNAWFQAKEVTSGQTETVAADSKVKIWLSKPFIRMNVEQGT